MDKVFLWQVSSNAVAIMNIDNLDSQTKVDNFWSDLGNPGVDIEPITLVLNIKPEKLLGLALVKQSMYILRTYEIEKKKMREFEFGNYHRELDLADSNFKVVSIDKSQKTNLFFAALQANKAYPKIVQIKIAKEGLSVVSSVNIELAEFYSVNRINTYQISKQDYVLVSGTNSLMLLKSKDKNLSILYSFQHICKGEFTDACISRNRFFLVSPGATFIVEASASNKIDDAELESIQRRYSGKVADEIEYDRFVVTKLDLPSNTYNRLDINKKGDVLYISGKGVLAISGIDSSKPTKSDSFYDSIFINNLDRQFSLIKCIRNGNILLQDTKSNDLIELSSTLKEFKRFKGYPGMLLQNDSFRSCRHSHDDNILPWMKGGNLLSLVTIKDLSMKEVKNFFSLENETDVIPLTTVCNPNADKIFGTSLYLGKMRISYWEKSSTTKHSSISDLFAFCS